MLQVVNSGVQFKLTASVPEFAGAMATAASQQRLLFPTQMRHVVEQDVDPYVGRVPAQLLADTGLSEREWLDFVEGHLLKYLRKNWLRLRYDSATVSVTKRRFLFFRRPVETGNTVTVKYVGDGFHGVVYRLTVGGRHYALKQFFFTNTPYEEIAVGNYFTHIKTRDLSHFYVGNPRRRWMLTEFIDNNTRLEVREGKTLDEHGYLFLDDPGTNRIRGIRVDYGGIKRKKV